MDQQQLSKINDEGKTRYGDKHWEAALSAISKFTGGAGFSPQDVAQLQVMPDAAKFLMNAGRHALMQQASDGDRDAERAYSDLRHSEREAYRRARGR
jgi:hypothetical protein